MRKWPIMLSFFTAMTMAACAAKNGEPVDFANACKPESDKKYYEVAGYLSPRGSVFCSNIGSSRVECGLDFLEAPGSDKKFSAEIQQGTQANSIEKLESGYKDADVKIHDINGQLINMSEKVRITGKMSTTPDGSVCFMQVDKIEK